MWEVKFSGCVNEIEFCKKKSKLQNYTTLHALCQSWEKKVMVAEEYKYLSLHPNNRLDRRCSVIKEEREQAVLRES